ncbi:MAG: NAD(P)-binding domain-containing protein, partial [Thiolinea sp.]
MNIGFIGLGVMGAPMAEQLANAGHNIITCLNASPLPENLQGKAEVVNSPTQVAAQCDTIITMVPDTPDVERVIAGADGVLENVTEQSLVIDMSSISPVATKA